MLASFVSALSLLVVTAHPPVMEGDIVFHVSDTPQAAAVSAATGSPIGHVGIVTLVDGEPHVYEAAGPVGMVSLAQFKRRGVGGKLWVKRLKDRDQVLTPQVLARMRKVARSYQGRPYDLYFQWSKARLYCSELVYDIYLVGAGVSIGQVQQVGDLDLTSKIVKRLITKRFKRQLKRPLDKSELIITPVAMFEDPRLMTVSAPEGD
ncbi:MAG: YiiX/YebB-like N1pC/P60 family cysteine hydrolase [Myxococcota bacterium]